MRLPVLYPITDRRLASGRTHAQIVRLLAEGGATLVQVREKELSDRLLADAVRECLRIDGVRIIVNDRPDVARVVGAAGAHLGEDDLPAEAARALLGEGSTLGVSTHSVEGAVAACRLPVDYVALGPIFETPNASAARGALGLEAVACAAQRMTKPLVAIGGITLERAAAILDAGAASVAVIADLMTAPDIAGRVRAFLALGRGTP
jgi:thiamine-phosphate pyrophosphorylase